MRTFRAGYRGSGGGVVEVGGGRGGGGGGAGGGRGDRDAWSLGFGCSVGVLVL